MRTHIAIVVLGLMAVMLGLGAMDRYFDGIVPNGSYIDVPLDGDWMALDYYASAPVNDSKPGQIAVYDDTEPLASMSSGEIKLPIAI